MNMPNLNFVKIILTVHSTREGEEKKEGNKSVSGIKTKDSDLSHSCEKFKSHLYLIIAKISKQALSEK